jgi:uncharacterized protein (TIGR02597 family)
MRKNFILFLAAATALGQVLACAASSVSVSSLPQGMVTLAAPYGSTTYLSLPLSSAAIYSGTVGSVGASSISVTNITSPFKTNLASASAPYFVKFLTGNEKGRVLLITANTTTSLTLNTTDDSVQTVSLTTSGFSVQAGDAFEVVTGDTLASVFGADNFQSPLTLTGSTSYASADWVNIYNPSTSSWVSYYFNTNILCWCAEGSTSNSNNTILYPYQGLSITRHTGTGASTPLLLTGRIAEVPVLTKVTGNNTVYASTGYAVNMKLSQINFGSSWAKGTSTATADVVTVWNANSSVFVSYYQMPDSTWRQSGNTGTNQSSVVIPAGSCIGIQHHTAATGAASYLPSAMPYTVSTF